MALALDGHTGVNTSAATAALSLVTANANDVIYLAASGNVPSGISFSSDASGLSWTIRSSNPFGSGSDSMVTAWAPAASAGTFNITITNLNGATNATYQAWGISGANNVSPFDGAIVQSTVANTSPSITTTNANDFIMCGFDKSSATVTFSGGFSTIDATNYQTTGYRIVSSTFSGSVGATGTWTASFADAVKQLVVVVPDTLAGPMNLIHMKRKSIGWTPLFDHRRRVLRPNRALFVPHKLVLPKNFKKVA